MDVANLVTGGKLNPEEGTDIAAYVGLYWRGYYAVW